MTAGDIDLGIGTFVGLVDCIVAGLLNGQPVLALIMLLACPIGYAFMGALIHLRQLPSIVVTLGASFVWLGLALMVLPLPGGTVPSALTALVRLHPPFVPMPIVLAVIPMVIAHLILNKMSYGVVLRGIGGSLAAVERAGRSTLKARMVLYAMAGVCGLCAGLCLAATTTTGDANVGRGFTLLYRSGHHWRRRIRWRRRVTHWHGVRRPDHAALRFAAEFRLRGAGLAVQHSGCDIACYPGAPRRFLEA
jgi:ribose transport system permease protein